MEQQNRLQQIAVKALMKQHGWDERTAASVLLTILAVVDLAPKAK